jgi:hypothetical protein
VADSAVNRDPFRLFEAAAAEYDLWANTQRVTPWVEGNYAQCYAAQHASGGKPGGKVELAALASGEVYNAGVVGGKAAAFVDLAEAMVGEFEEVYGRGAAWNCDMSALQRALTAGGERPLARRRVFGRGRPFCGGSAACLERGECDYHLWHK